MLSRTCIHLPTREAAGRRRPKRRRAPSSASPQPRPEKSTLFSAACSRCPFLHHERFSVLARRRSSRLFSPSLMPYLVVRLGITRAGHPDRELARWMSVDHTSGPEVALSPI